MTNIQNTILDSKCIRMIILNGNSIKPLLHDNMEGSCVGVKISERGEDVMIPVQL